MSTVTIVGIVALLIAFVVLTELMAAALPLLLVITLVPHEERQQLAELIAVTDRSRRLRLWHALRVAVAAQRLQNR
jgi:hypothetical protein